MSRQKRGRSLTFAAKDEIYKMSAPGSVEAIRLRELRKAFIDLIEIMQVEGWLPEDSEAKANMESAFVQLWNEFNSIYEAQVSDDSKNNLFKYFPGQLIQTAEDKNYLRAGDRVKIVTKRTNGSRGNGSVLEVTKPYCTLGISGYFQGVHSNNGEWRNNAPDWYWEYIGNKHESQTHNVTDVSVAAICQQC